MNKNSLTYLSVFSMMVGVTSCQKPVIDHLYRLEKVYGIKGLKEADLSFYYKHISGLDSAGIYYFEFKYESDQLSFFNQFVGKSEQNCFDFGPNHDFEVKVENLLSVSRDVRKDYDLFEPDQKLDWNKPYVYTNNQPECVTLPIIYFEEDFRLIIIQLQQ